MTEPAFPAEPTRRRYRGARLDVSFDPEVCTHAAECVRGAPEVFDVNARPWISPDAAAADRIVEVVGRCPSGALRTHEHVGG